MRAILLLLLLYCLPVPARQNSDLTGALREAARRFEHLRVISLAESLLSGGIQDTTTRIEVLRLKGIAHYNLNQMDAALRDFSDILKLNPGYRMNPIENSPKIVAVFNTLRDRFKQPPRQIIRYDTVRVKQRVSLSLTGLLLPGYGQLQRGEQTRGWLMLAGSMTSLGVGIYSAIDCADKEKRYLNETDKKLIADKYEAYNRSYQLRNAALGVFAVFWAWAQYDYFVPLSIRPGPAPQITLQFEF